MFSKYSLKAFLLSLALLAASSGLLLGEEPYYLAEINTQDVNLRSDATVASRVISILRKGERVEVVTENYDWCKVRLPKRVSVYIKNSFAICLKRATASMSVPASTEQCVSAKVTGDRVNIRAKPGEDAPIVGVADMNEVVNVISEYGSWYRIEPIQNSFGWVNKKFISKLPFPVEPEQPSGSSQDKAVILKDSQDNLAVFSGIVEPYGVVFFRPATHKLITPENKIYFLKANRISLNALNHQKVKITGKIISGLKAKYPVIDVKIIEAAS